MAEENRPQRDSELTHADRAQEKTIDDTVAEEKAVLDALEEARQNVKSIAKKEMMGEALTSEILNFRLNAPR